MTIASNPQDFFESIQGMQDYDDHEDVVYAEDQTTGLRAFIAVHNTSRGPGVGGTRLWQYQDAQSALTDVLRLSRGMTYKNSFSQLPFGGAKAVVMAPDFSKWRRPKLMEALGRMINRLEGRYYTAEDVGTTCQDMEDVRRGTDYIFGLEGSSGDPSPFTARGVFLGIEACIEERLQTSSLKGIRVLVQGVGHVGYYLCKLLHQHGVQLLVTDISKPAIERCVQEFNAIVIPPDSCYDVEAEVYAPCALGATIHDRTLDRLKVSVIAGAANNQLLTEDVAELVRQKDILYAPDYVINAGGIINIACEMHDVYCVERVIEEIAKIKPRIKRVIEQSRASHTDTLTIANQIAREQFSRRTESGRGASYFALGTEQESSFANPHA